jgi:HK97 family phage portal protein
MGIVQTLFQKIGYAPIQAEPEQRSTLTQPEQWFMDWATGLMTESGSGVPVTKETALSISAVYACCRIISNTIASLHLGLYRRLPSGDTEEVTDLPEYLIPCLEPNDLYSRFTFDSTSEFHLSMHGNSYTRLYFGRAGRISKMEVVRPDMVTPFLKNGKLYYQYADIDGLTHTVSDWEMLHFKNFSEDGLIGKSPLQVARETFGMAIAANKYAANMYKNGGYMKGVLETDRDLKTEQIAQLRTSFSSVLQDYTNTNGVAVLGGGMKYKQVSMSPKDAEFIAASKMSVLDICRYYGVPPHLVAEMTNSTYSNIEQQAIEFVQNLIRPKVKLRETEMNRRLLRQSDKAQLFYRYNLDSLLRGDTAARGAYIVQMLQNGVYNIDEARKLDNLNQLPDGIGKVHYRPLNMVEVGVTPDPNSQNNDPSATGQQNTDNGTPQAGK